MGKRLYLERQRTGMSNKHLKTELLLKYTAMCMAGGDFSYANPLTVHHIIRSYDGGKSDLINGSLIANKEHIAYIIR